MVETLNRDVTTALQVRATEGLQSVLVPVDLTAISDRVVARLSLLPIAEHGRVGLLHVVSEQLGVRDQHRAEREAYRFLDDEVRHLAGALPEHVRLRPMVEFGAPAKAIIARANAMNAELIVMGRGGGRALRDVFLGSTAERVLRGSSRPVLVVRLPARKPYQHPALALDLDPPPDDVVAVLLCVLPLRHPSVSIIHAFDPYSGMMSVTLTDEEAEDRSDELAHRARQDLARLLATALVRADIAPGDAPYWRYQVQAGSPRIVIEKAVRRAGTDLLALGTHGRKGITHLLLGSVAGDVLREVACDVLVVPPTG